MSGQHVSFNVGMIVALVFADCTFIFSLVVSLVGLDMCLVTEPFDHLVAVGTLHVRF